MKTNLSKELDDLEKDKLKINYELEVNKNYLTHQLINEMGKSIIADLEMVYKEPNIFKRFYLKTSKIIKKFKNIL